MPKTYIVLIVEIVSLLFVFNHIFKTRFGLNLCKCTGQQVIKWIISPNIIPIGVDDKIYDQVSLLLKNHHYLNF